MLLRPQESAFVDKEHSNLQFLVLDELHMYRGRQGADVAMLLRRLKAVSYTHLGKTPCWGIRDVATQSSRR